MYSEHAQYRIDYVNKWAKEMMSGVYNLVSAYDKLLTIDTFDSTISIGLSSIDISYTLKKEDNLVFTANQLLENIDEVLNFKEINVDTSEYLTSMQIFKFDCKLQTGERVEIYNYFSESKDCSVEYKEVTTKKAILKCS